MYNKPVSIITTHSDPQGRRTVFQEVSDRIKERVVSVGRLDINSEGLLLLTNNPEFANFAEDPRNGWRRIYKVRVYGELTDQILEKISRGVEINGRSYMPMNITKLSGGGRNSWIMCELFEGQNREIRRIFQEFGLLVSRLIRTDYGPYSLGDLKHGDVRLCECSVAFNSRG
jgi:23S rRNA pseudouridine2605 synthase